MLLSAQQLAGAAAPPSAIKNLRERERVTRYHVYSYHWSPRSDAIYFLSNDQVYLYNLAARRITRITHAAGAKRDPKLSPDERWISYVSDGDVHYASVDGGPIRSVAPHAAGVLNGELDWVYTEELDLRSAYSWSPDSRYIAFLQFDERPVQDFPLIDYLHPQPTVYLEKYPTAGSANPIVRLGVYDLQTGKLHWMPLAGTADTYLVRFGWLPQGHQVFGEVLNRDQTELQLVECNPDSGQVRSLITQKDPDWIDVGTRRISSKPAASSGAASRMAGTTSTSTATTDAWRAS